MAKHSVPQPVAALARPAVVAPVVVMPAAVYVERLRGWTPAPIGRHARV